MIDSHCHLNCLEDVNRSLDMIIAQAHDVGVTHILCPGIDPPHFAQIIDIATQYSQVKAGLGVHPNDVSTHAITEAALYEWVDHPEVIAVGETGLDYYRDSSDPALQAEQFRIHIRVAKALKKPLIIHARAAHMDILKILREEAAGPAIMHCFTETLEIAEAAIDLGCLISFSGIITFKNAEDLRRVAKQVPLESILIETDAPYLAPMPFRGKPNFPEYVVYVAEKLAEIKEISVEQVAQETSANFKRLFGWPV